MLIGDHHQLPEIDAGGAFAGLVARVDPITLTINRRQRQDWERATLDQLRVGADVADVVATYRDQGRLTIADTADDVRHQLVSDWWDAWHTHGPAAGVMIALRVADIDDLNLRARDRLRDAGFLAGPAVTTTAGLEFQRGDRVITRLAATFPATNGSGRVGVVNGQRGTIIDIDPDRQNVTISTDRTPDIALAVPARYLDAGHLEHGYAVTGHRAQGLTSQRAWVLFSDALYREWGYVALSRSREHTQIYLVADNETDHDDLDRHGVQPDQRSPTKRATDWLDRSKAQQLALDFTLSDNNT